MLNRVDIEETIDEILDTDITLANCGDLASLYILLDHLPNERPQTDDIQTMLVEYMCKRDVVSLNVLLTKFSEVLSELYHTCDTQEEVSEFREFVERTNSILTPTVL